MAAERPIPPFLPDTVEDFIANVNDSPAPWVEYLRKAHDFITTTPVPLEQDTTDLLERIPAQDAEIAYLKEKVNTLKNENIRHQAIIEFQRQEADRYNDKLRRAEMDRDRAVAQAIAPVPTPAFTTPSSQAKDLVDPPARTTPFTAPSPSEHSMRSDKLPDPNVFTGDRKDLRRFLSQVSQKLRVNYDRYPTPAARLAYVSSRLSGPAYSQVLPHINSDGSCQLSDYPDILGILERAYGDPNRVNNARTELLQLRQKNQEFSTFFAEFQRLALEGELADDALSTILDNAISRELRGMLMHNPPLSRELNLFAKHLQDLENRRRQYSSYPTTTTNSITKTHSTPRTTSPAPPYSQVTARVTTEPMDLSNTRRRTDKETGNCFRCHQSGHRIRDCPQPDTRPQSYQRRDSDARRYRMSVLGVQSPSPPQSPRNHFAALQSHDSMSLRQPTPVRPATPAFSPNPANESENGLRLG
jgi:hypothetical protein